jgi:hypothetical protein
VQMYGLLNAHFLVQALHVAATLRIADLLADGAKRVGELAQASSSHAPSLYRSKILDLIMLALQHGGRVRTEVEHRALLEAAGLELTHVIPTPSPLSLLEGVRR